MLLPGVLTVPWEAPQSLRAILALPAVAVLSRARARHAVERMARGVLGARPAAPRPSPPSPRWESSPISTWTHISERKRETRKFTPPSPRTRRSWREAKRNIRAAAIPSGRPDSSSSD